MSRTKDYRIVINKTPADILEYTQQVDLKCIDTEQEIYKRASIWVESFSWSHNEEKQSTSQLMFIKCSLPQVRTMSLDNYYNLGNCNLLEAIPIKIDFVNGSYCYYNASNNSHKVAVPITSVQSNFNVSIGNSNLGIGNLLLSQFCLILRIELSE